MQYLNVYVFVLLGVALAQAIPASKTEARLEKSLSLEGASDDKERAKKSTICLDIRGPEENSQAQVVPVPAQVQTYSVQAAPVQAMNVIQAPQQLVQPLNLIQAPQQVQQQSILIPQPIPQPVHTLQIFQQPQPCPQQETINVAPQKLTISEPKPEPSIPKPSPPPAPKPTTQRPVERIIETFVPVEAPCKEQVLVVPTKPVVLMPEQPKLAGFVNVPHCPHHHAGSTQCNCRQVGSAPIRLADMGTRDHLLQHRMYRV